MFLIIDNYDSFVHNLARYFEIAGVETLIKRNDKIKIAEIEKLNPEAIILSPGPCKPQDSGICLEIVRHFTNTPILGVCLGHQCIAEDEGAETVKAAEPVHGRASTITHDGKGLFKNIPSPMKVGRYHSLINDISKTNLMITAKTQDGTPMALQHKTRPLYGVQFHPESILTEHGQSLIDNFVDIVQNSGVSTTDVNFTMNDRGFRGHGVFDTILVRNGKAVYLAEHMERLKNHTRAMNIDIDINIGDFELQNGALSILITGGTAERGLKAPENPKPQIAVRVFETPENYGPIHAIIAQKTRRNELSPLSQIKSLNYGDNILAMQEAEKQGANEAILLNTKGYIACFTTGNLFILKKGKLYTPPLSDGVMNGITRQKWMAREKITEKSLKPKDLEKADAIFLTNSLRGIVPVLSLNGKTIKPVDFTFDRHIHHG